MENSRRIVQQPFTPPAPGEHSPKLKQVAGLIQSLTFREMTQFAELVASECPNEGPDTITEALLQVTDKILSK